MKRIMEARHADFRNRYAGLGCFREIDFHFAEFILNRSDSHDSHSASREMLYQAALLLSHVTGLQNAALDLKSAAGQPIESFSGIEQPSFKALSISLADYARWLNVLRDEYGRLVGRPGEKKPLILDDNGLLYLYRYWDYEQRVADAVIKRCDSLSEPLSGQELLDSLFPEAGDGIDWQKVAAVSAFRSRFCVISGGPGTGKTTTVARLVAMLLNARPGLVIDMVAPTGKAADRLTKSVQAAKTRLHLPDELKKLMPEKATTIHRYLGYLPSVNTFRKNANNRTASGLLIVDEASMVSLPLFACLLEAIPDDCRVILLGDKDQLASVETGCVFGSLATAEVTNRFSNAFASDYKELSEQMGLPVTDSPTILTDRVIKLEHSYRFGRGSGIGHLSFLVNEAETEEDASDIMTFLKERKLSISVRKKLRKAGRPEPSVDLFQDIEWKELPEPGHLKSTLKKIIKDNFAHYRDEVSRFEAGNARVEDVLSALDSFRILCAVNQGIFGVENLNVVCEDELFGLKKGMFYSGRPVMVLTNDYTQRLFNGDVGVILKNADGTIRAYFQGENGSVRSFSTVCLPAHETAFAMTVHKSQGSEFDRVLMILPEQDLRILTKEIIYTGITRARQSVAVWGSQAIIKAAVCRSSSRVSGLKALLSRQSASESASQ